MPRYWTSGNQAEVDFLLHVKNDIIPIAVKAVGDTDAFARIFEHYQPRIFTFCLPILHSEMLAEEVGQEVMLKLWRISGQPPGCLDC